MTISDIQDGDSIAHYVAKICDLSTLGGEGSLDARIAHESVEKAVVWVIEARRVDLLQMLLDEGLPLHARFSSMAGNSIPTKSDGSGRHSLLMLCVQKTFADGLELLLERGADIALSRDDYGGHGGQTILGKAFDSEWITGVEIILKHRSLSDLYGQKMALAKDGTQADAGLFAAADHRMIDLLIEAGMSRSGLLRRACWIYDKPSLAEHLIGLGCEVNEAGLEPIVSAATRGHPDVLKLLLEHGADATVKNKQGRTLLQCAGKNTEVKALLRAWKAGGAIESAIGAESSPAPARREKGLMPL